MPGAEGYVAESLAKRLFDARLELIVALDPGMKGEQWTLAKEEVATYGDPQTDEEVRQAVAELLHREVAAMKLDNFIVRPHRRLIEEYAKREPWAALTSEALAELSQEVAALPTELDPENEEAKRFDLLALTLQLSLLRAGPRFEWLRERVKETEGLLSEKDAIPMVREQMALIQDILTEAWWQDVTVPMLEAMRRRLRGLVQCIDKRQSQAVYADSEDSMGAETGFTLPGFAVGTDQAKFMAKARAFLRQHLDHVAIAKLRRNRPLTPSDLSELERLLGDWGGRTGGHPPGRGRSAGSGPSRPRARRDGQSGSQGGIGEVYERKDAGCQSARVCIVGSAI